LDTYGSRAFDVALIASKSKNKAERILEELPYIKAEMDYAV